MAIIVCGLVLRLAPDLTEARYVTEEVNACPSRMATHRLSCYPQYASRKFMCDWYEVLAIGLYYSRERDCEPRKISPLAPTNIISVTFIFLPFQYLVPVGS